MTQLRRKEREDEEKIRKENKTLMKEIIDTTRGKRANNLLLIGRSGAGKSTMVNTLIQVIVGRSIPRLPCGGGNVASKTLDLNWLEHCGVLPDDVKNLPNEDELRDLIKNLPNIFDFAGLGDIDTPVLEEILKFLIGGFIKPGTTISALDDLQKKHGVGSFDSIFTKPIPEYKVSKILFVHNCGENVPKRLLGCLQRVIRAIDEKTGALLFNAEIYAVLTKYDIVENNEYFEAVVDFEVVGGSGQLVAGQSGDSTSSPDNNPFIIPLADFKQRENSIAQELAIVGAKDSNLVRWISYSDTIGFDENPYVTNIGLSFLKRMLVLGIDQPEIVEPKAKLRFACRKAWKCFRKTVNFDLHLTPLNLLAAFIVLVFVYLVYDVLAKSV